jgi:hypothetical protein
MKMLPTVPGSSWVKLLFVFVRVGKGWRQGHVFALGKYAQWAPAGLLFRFVVRVAPTNDFRIFFRGVVLVISVARTICVAHTFQVVGQTHLDSFCIGGDPVGRTGSL